MGINSDRTNPAPRTQLQNHHSCAYETKDITIDRERTGITVTDSRWRGSRGLHGDMEVVVVVVSVGVVVVVGEGVVVVVGEGVVVVVGEGVVVVGEGVVVVRTIPESSAYTL
jgi:hypothetical protein